MIVRILIVLAMVLSFRPAVACERPLRVFVDDWPPYVQLRMQQGDLRVDGQDVFILQHLADALGCQLTWVQMPVDRAHSALRTGKVDILLAASRIPQRESYAWFSAPYRNETIAVLGKLNVRPLTGWQEIIDKALVLAVPRQGWYGQDYEKYRPVLIENQQLAFIGDYRSGVAMLKAGRVDLAMGDVGALEAAGHEVGLVMSRPVLTLSEGPVHFMFSRASMERRTVERFNQLLAQWQGNGTLDYLRRPYLP